MSFIAIYKYLDFDSKNAGQWSEIMSAAEQGDVYSQPDRLRFIFAGSPTVDIYGEFPPSDNPDPVSYFLDAKVTSINISGYISISSLTGVTLRDVLSSAMLWDLIDLGDAITYYGSDYYDDDIFGGSFADRLNGMAGNDIVFGFAGNDDLKGGEGNDVLFGGSGADWLYGDAGFDIASYAESETGLTVMLGHPAKNTGEAKGDSFQSIEGIIGSQFKDILIGTADKNSLEGGAGKDRLTGGQGQDFLTGGVGNDVFVFGYSNKRGVERFDSGLEELTWDVVTDFERGQDRLELDQSVNAALKFIGMRDFTGKGQVRFEKDDDGLTVFVNSDKDKAPEMAIRLDDVTSLTASDFIF